MPDDEWQESWEEADDSELLEDGHRRNIWSSLLLRLTALVTLLAFTATALGIWPANFRLPSLDFLLKSVQLSKNPEYQQLQKAVFMVKTPNSQGTGFNVRSDGLVITNLHVVANSRDLWVRTPEGVTYRGELLSSNQVWDLALLKIQAHDLPVVSLGDAVPKAGEKVVIIGDPLGFRQVIVEGRVKGITSLEGWAEPVLRLQGDIHPGNSGSPVFNTRGQVVGVVFATVGGGEDTLSRDGLAIPVDYLHKLIK